LKLIQTEPLCSAATRREQSPEVEMLAQPLSPDGASVLVKVTPPSVDVHTLPFAAVAITCCPSALTVMEDQTASLGRPLLMALTSRNDAPPSVLTHSPDWSPPLPSAPAHMILPSLETAEVDQL
jgi:hypothetical protein